MFSIAEQACNSVAECPFDKREVSGSIPLKPIFSEEWFSGRMLASKAIDVGSIPTSFVRLSV